MMSKISIIKTLITIASLSAISYFTVKCYIDYKDDRLKKEIIGKIDRFFSNKPVISDGEFQSVSVEQINIPSIYLWGTKIHPEYDNLESFYRCLSGGFHIIIATRMSEKEIDIKNIYATNMGYKITDDGYWNSLPSFNEAYKSAYNLLTIEDVSKGFTNGMYNQISNLHTLSNEYYSLTSWGEYSSTNDAYIQNYYWKVFYSYKGREYNLRLDTSAKQSEFWKIFSLSIFVILVLSFFIAGHSDPADF